MITDHPPTKFRSRPSGDLAAPAAPPYVIGDDGGQCPPPWLQCGCNLGLGSRSVLAARLPSRERGQSRSMSGETDQAKGRIKQAVGDLSDDKDMKREGKIDELAVKAKDGVDKVKDKLTGKDD